MNKYNKYIEDELKVYFDIIKIVDKLDKAIEILKIYDYEEYKQLLEEYEQLSKKLERIAAEYYNRGL